MRAAMHMHQPTLCSKDSWHHGKHATAIITLDISTASENQVHSSSMVDPCQFAEHSLPVSWWECNICYALILDSMHPQCIKWSQILSCHRGDHHGNHHSNYHVKYYSDHHGNICRNHHGHHHDNHIPSSS